LRGEGIVKRGGKRRLFYVSYSRRKREKKGGPLCDCGMIGRDEVDTEGGKKEGGRRRRFSFHEEGKRGERRLIYMVVKKGGRPLGGRGEGGRVVYPSLCCRKERGAIRRR